MLPPLGAGLYKFAWSKYSSGILSPSQDFLNRRFQNQHATLFFLRELIFVLNLMQCKYSQLSIIRSCLIGIVGQLEVNWGSHQFFMQSYGNKNSVRFQSKASRRSQGLIKLLFLKCRNSFVCRSGIDSITADYRATAHEALRLRCEARHKLHVCIFVSVSFLELVRKHIGFIPLAFPRVAFQLHLRRFLDSIAHLTRWRKSRFWKKLRKEAPHTEIRYQA